MPHQRGTGAGRTSRSRRVPSITSTIRSISTPIRRTTPTGRTATRRSPVADVVGEVATIGVELELLRPEALDLNPKKQHQGRWGWQCGRSQGHHQGSSGR